MQSTTMMAKHAFFAAIAVLLLNMVPGSDAFTFSFGWCRSAPAIQDFNVTQYAGLWYEIERTDVFFQRDLDCVTAYYTKLNDATLTVVNKGFNFKKMITKGISGEASVLDLEEPNKLSVRFTNVPITGKYDIWATNYKSYALVHSCVSVLPFFIKMETVYILSRTPQMSNATLFNLKKILSSRGVSVSNLRRTVQGESSGCNYNYNTL